MSCSKVEAEALNMLWFGRRKKRDKEFKNKLAKVDERQSQVDEKIDIVNTRTDNLNKLIKRANKGNGTLKILLVMGVDRRTSNE